MMKRTRPRSGGRGLGIRFQLFLMLILFILIVLFLIWLFQIRLLNFFYEATKYSELDRTGRELSYFLDDEEELETAVYDYASSFNICVTVYRLEGNSAKAVVETHISGACAVHQLTGAERSELYDAAMANGGSYSEKITVKRKIISRRESWIGDEENLEPTIVIEEVDNAVSVRLAKDSSGQTYILLLDSKLTPVSSIVTTLGLQFNWIFVILMGLALIFAVLISRLVLRPIVSMNASAKQLAAGNYNADFRGSGFRESHELADTLNYASAELSKTDRMRKELLANVSHDLRTPLTMIKGYGEIMRDIPGENSPENVQVIIDEAERLNLLVSDMLDLSRIESGNHTPSLSVFNLTETVRTTISRYDKLTAADGFCITFAADEDLSVSGDRTMLLQVICNLINNAVNYAGENKRVTVMQTRTADSVRIAVSDTGVGIPNEELPLIWDRYYKVDKVHRRATVGTGLGLSIVKGVLEMHGATYGVESAVGKGSTFWFTLPIAGEGQPEEKPMED